MSYACTSCGSENTQKLSIIYHSGTTTINTTTIGAGIAGGRGAIGLGSTTGNSQSKLAEKYRPPQKKDIKGAGCLAALVLLGAAFFQSELALGIALAIDAVILWAALREATTFNREQYPQMYARWERLMLCLRCGNIFESGQPTIPVTPLISDAGPTVGHVQATAPAAESYAVLLVSPGEKTITVIQAIRSATNYDLRTAKNIVDAAPSTVKAGISHAEASDIQFRLSMAGAIATVQQSAKSTPSDAELPLPSADPLPVAHAHQPIGLAGDGQPIGRSIGRALEGQPSNSRWIVCGLLLAIPVAFLAYKYSATAPAVVATPEQTGQPNSLDEPLPSKIGMCAHTQIKSIGTRLETTPGSGSEIEYTNGGHQVSYEDVPGIDNSTIGDAVKICLTELPKDCPAGDERGKVYETTNIRTHSVWKESDSEHRCGGA